MRFTHAQVLDPTTSTEPRKVNFRVMPVPFILFILGSPDDS